MLKALSLVFCLLVTVVGLTVAGAVVIHNGWLWVVAGVVAVAVVVWQVAIVREALAETKRRRADHARRP